MRFNPPPNWPAPPKGWRPPPGWQPDPAWGPPPEGWSLWVRDRNWFARNKVLTVLLAIFVVIPAVSGVLRGIQSDARPSGAESAIGATTSLSQHDVKVLSELGTYPRQWNAAAAPFVRDYQDPNVSAEEWLASAGAQVEAMRAAARGLDMQVLSISDAGVRATLEPLSSNYKRKFAAVIALRNAVAAGDQTGEAAANAELSSAAADGQRLAAALADRLRPYMTQ